ncbi:hypothetical protein [Paracoccus sp. (in: a-proteobacteria)]|uniref:hypothetical protein n=1 Tax=Paracoccus sp. TaxID=267 RepID=UPI003A84063C
MAQFTSHGLKGGIWSGRIAAATLPPRICLVHHGEVVSLARMTPDGDGFWHAEIDLPPESLSDGRHSFLLIADAGEGAEPVHHGALRLDRLNIVAGAPLDEDLATEIQMLRAELELLKREFRRLASEG